MKNKIPYILIALAFCTFLYFYSTSPPKILAKCPEDYPDTDVGFKAKTTAMDDWLNDFYDKNPGASLSEMAKARYQFYMDNNCSDTLERYFEAKEGKADPAEMKIIRDTIQQEIKNQAEKNLMNELNKDKSNEK